MRAHSRFAARQGPSAAATCVTGSQLTHDADSPSQEGCKPRLRGSFEQGTTKREKSRRRCSFTPHACAHHCGAGPCAASRNAGLAAKLDAERKLKEGISGHKTGLPKKLLELFDPLPPLARLPELRKRPAKVPYSGIAPFTELFAAPGNEEYEPPPELPRPPSPRRFRNPELATQARVDLESKAEKCAPALHPLCVAVHAVTAWLVAQRAVRCILAALQIAHACTCMLGSCERCL